VGRALVVPAMSLQRGFRLNNLSSSFTAEAIVITKAMDCAMTEGWVSINIYSLSVLTKLKAGLSSIFPYTKINLSPIMMDMLKISKIIHSGIEIKSHGVRLMSELGEMN